LSELRVKMPEWSDGLFAEGRYKVIHGGRGSGKSWAVARALLILAAAKPMRVLCTREVQESIKDSVHRLLSDQIQALGLGQQFEVTQAEIRGKNGSLFVFSGLASQTVESIKSFEGIDIAWCEEAQSVSKRSWDVLLPTIRKPNSQVWMTLNPLLETDETYARFVADAPASAWVKRVNWRDNPWFPDVLEYERLETKRRDPDAYPNLWEGEPLRVAEGAIYRHEIDAMYAANRVRLLPHDPILKVHTVWDLGWNDAMSIGMFQRSSSALMCINYLENTHRTVDWYVKQLEANKDYRWGTDFIPHDGRSRDHNSGKSTEDILQQMGRRPHVLPPLSVEEGIKSARMIFPRTYIDSEKCARLIECLKRYRRTLSKGGEPMAPLHDVFSHGADMFRYAALSANQMHNWDEMAAHELEPATFDD
jgi:phage terminase large subunit